VSGRRGNSYRRGCWSRTGSRSYGSSSSSSSRGASSLGNCSSRHPAACPSQCRRHHKSLKLGRRFCLSMVHRPRRGFVRERLPRSQLSQGERTTWWSSPV